MKSLDIVIFGCGNVAAHFADRFIKHQHCIVQIYHPDITKVEKFAEAYSTQAINDLHLVTPDADLYFIAVKDNAIETIAQQIKVQSGIVLHTSGSMKADVLSRHQRYAVFYPLQTFTKGIKTIQNQFPLLIECSQKKDQDFLVSLSESIGLKPNIMNSDQRAEIHLAAVFASNFSNHCIKIAYDLMKHNKYDATMLLPLIKENINKLDYISPEKAQTGPAIRHDNQIIEKHLKMLDSNKELKQLYELITKHIQQTDNKL